MFQAVIFIACFSQDLALEKKEFCTHQIEIRRQSLLFEAWMLLLGGALSFVEEFFPLASLSLSPSLSLSLSYFSFSLSPSFCLSPQRVTTFPVPDKPFPYAWYCSKLFFRMTFSSGFAVLGELVSNCIENQNLK